MKNNFLVNFILLHGYSLDNSSLMFGKMGYSLILFEYSHYFKDALAEKHAFELLQEVLASPMKSNTFNEGKMGIAWSLIHLIEKEYIEADYLELYGQEHKEICITSFAIRICSLNFFPELEWLVSMMAAGWMTSIFSYIS